MVVRRVLDRQHAADTGQLRGLRGDRCGVRREHHDGDLGAAKCRGHR